MLSTIIWQVLCCHKEHSMIVTVFVTPWRVQCDSNVSVTPWTVACQAPLSMGFSRQEYWSGLPCPPSGYLSHPGIKIRVSCGSCIAGGFVTAEPLRKKHYTPKKHYKQSQKACHNQEEDICNAHN